MLGREKIISIINKYKDIAKKVPNSFTPDFDAEGYTKIIIPDEQGNMKMVIFYKIGRKYIHIYWRTPDTYARLPNGLYQIGYYYLKIGVEELGKI